MARSLENRPYSQSKIIESYGGGGGHPVVSDSGFTRPPRRGAGRSTWLGSGATQGVACPLANGPTDGHSGSIWFAQSSSGSLPQCRPPPPRSRFGLPAAPSPPLRPFFFFLSAQSPPPPPGG